MTPAQLKRIYEENVRRRQRLVMAHYIASGSGTALPEGPAPVTLGALGGTFTLSEDALANTVAGAITGRTTGSTLSLFDTAGNRVELSGLNILRGATGLDYETATSHSFTVRETLAGATNTPRDTVFSLTVTDVVEPSYPAVITARAKEAVYDRATSTGYTQALTTIISNTNRPVITGVTYFQSGAQWCMRIDGGGVTINNTEIRIPIMNMNSGLAATTLNQCFLNASNYSLAYAMVGNGYNQDAGSNIDNCSIVLNDCEVAYSGRTPEPALYQYPSFLLINGSSTNLNNSMTLNRCKVRSALASHVLSKGNLIITDGFHGGHGMHSTATEADLHSEAIYPWRGNCTITGTLFEQADSETVRKEKTWTAHIQAVAEQGTLNLSASRHQPSDQLRAGDRWRCGHDGVLRQRPRSTGKWSLLRLHRND